MYDSDRDPELQRLADDFEADAWLAAPPESCSVEEFVALRGYRPESHYYD